MSKKIVKYEGENADVTWDGRLCIHVGECGRAQNKLFVANRDPWCDPDVAALYETIEVVRRCPTGALSVVRKDGGPGDSTNDRNVVVIANNGPLYVNGELVISQALDNSPGLDFRAALCRCGLSKNKPFCDNSHEEGGFIDRGAVGDIDTGQPESEGGPLEITFAENGPILLRGHMTIIAGSGREAWNGSKCALCRCGKSKNKPFCDGSHKEEGFVAP